MNHYDGLFIIKPDIKNEESLNNIFAAIVESITKNGGAIDKEDKWGKKPLIYSIKKFKEGYYYKVNFSAPSSSVTKLESAYKLNSDILRTMITRR